MASDPYLTSHRSRSNVRDVDRKKSADRLETSEGIVEVEEPVPATAA